MKNKNNNVKSNDLAEHTFESALVARFIEFKENELIRTIITPLLERMGYDVDFHGGPYEEGKDLICWKRNELFETELTVVQVKKSKPTALMSDPNCFSEIINQLFQCAEKPVPHKNGNLYHPARIYFITPYSINTRVLTTRFEKYKEYRHLLNIIDGEMLASLLKKYAPEIANTLVGSDVLINQYTQALLTNNILMNALHHSNVRDISEFYCDLEFCVGKITTSFFLSLEFVPQIIEKVRCKITDWDALWALIKNAAKTFNAEILKNDANILECEVKELKKSYSDIQCNIEIEMTKIYSLLQSAQPYREKTFAWFKKSDEQDDTNITVVSVAFINEVIKLIGTNTELPADTILTKNETIERNKNIQDRLKKWNEMLSLPVASIISTNFQKEIEKYIEDFQTLLTQKKTVSIHGNSEIKATGIPLVISSQYEKIEKAAQKIYPSELLRPGINSAVKDVIDLALNEMNPKLTNLHNYKNILEESQKANRAWMKLKQVLVRDALNHNFINELQEHFNYIEQIGAIFSKLTKLFIERDRIVLNISLDGRSLAAAIITAKNSLLKEIQALNEVPSQTIQLKSFLQRCHTLFLLVDNLLTNKYFSELLGTTKKKTFVNISEHSRLSLSIMDIFATGLNLLVLGEAGAGKTTTLQMYTKHTLSILPDQKFVVYFPLSRMSGKPQGFENDSQGKPEWLMLEDVIISYVCSLGSQLNRSQVTTLMRQKEVTIALDGIDEIIQKAPWITKGITELPNHRPNYHLITSSRVAQYMDSIPFLAITLMPFTDKQRNGFIRNWFEKNMQHKSDAIINHFDKAKEIADVVRNPLLATLLCVLAEHNVNLPEDELRLYEQRMKLLVGHYDLHKQINRLDSLPEHLELIARKVAFSLHCANSRQASINHLEEMALSSLRQKLGPAQIKIGVKELINPCNILVPMSDDGLFGFGHLRYQEYLVACELNLDRGHDIYPLLNKEWWRSCILFYAKMADSLEFMIDAILKANHSNKILKMIDALINVRPVFERASLRRTVEFMKTVGIDQANYESMEEQYSEFNYIIDDVPEMSTEYDQ